MNKMSFCGHNQYIMGPFAIFCLFAGSDNAGSTATNDSPLGAILMILVCALIIGCVLSALPKDTVVRRVETTQWLRNSQVEPSWEELQARVNALEEKLKDQ